MILLPSLLLLRRCDAMHDGTAKVVLLLIMAEESLVSCQAYRDLLEDLLWKIEQRQYFSWKYIFLAPLVLDSNLSRRSHNWVIFIPVWALHKRVRFAISRRILSSRQIHTFVNIIINSRIFLELLAPVFYTEQVTNCPMYLKHVFKIN